MSISIQIGCYWKGNFISNCIDESVFDELSSNIDEGCSSNISLKLGFIGCRKQNFYLFAYKSKHYQYNQGGCGTDLSY